MRDIFGVPKEKTTQLCIYGCVTSYQSSGELDVQPLRLQNKLVARIRLFDKDLSIDWLT